MFSRILAICAIALGLSAPSAPAAELIMVEQDGCIYCARWDAEIAPIYPKTPEAQVLPLRRIDLHGPRPEDVSFKGALVLTPTFVLVEDGQELARIEGYAGDELFWSMLTVLMRDKMGINPGELDAAAMQTESDS